MKLLSIDKASIDYSNIRDLGNRLIVTGTLAIADQWMRYRNEDGSDRYEYVPESTLFDLDSLSTLQGAPLCLEHPGDITSDKYRELVFTGQEVGTISTQLNIDRDRKQLDIVAVIRDKPTIDKVLAGGITELSPQYWKHTKPHPDYKSNCFIQTARDYSGCEVSLVSQARGGKDASLHLGIATDSAEPQKFFLRSSTSKTKSIMATINVDGIDVKIEDSSKQILEKYIKSVNAVEAQLTKERDSANESVTASEIKIAKLEADNAALEVKNAQLEQEAEEIKAKAKLEKDASDRKDIITTASPIFQKNIDGFKAEQFDKLNNRQIKEGAIALSLKTLDAVKSNTLGECSEDKIDAYWSAVESMQTSSPNEAKESKDSSDPLRELLAGVEHIDRSEDSEGEKLENEYRLSLENAWEVK